MSVVTKESNPELYNALFPEDEIKEILDKLYLDFEKAGLTAPEYSYLRDYITNSQEDLEKVSGSHFKIFQENKILKEERKTLYRYTPEKGFRLVGDEDVKDKK